MSATNPTEPTVRKKWPEYFDAGETVKVDRWFDNFPATDWQYKVLIAGAQTLQASATSDPNGSIFHVVLTPAQTAPLNTTGASLAYAYTEQLSNATTGETYNVARGRIMVFPNLATAGAGALVSYEEQALQAIEKAILARLGGTPDGGIEHYSVAGRSVSKIPTAELIKLRGQFRAIVWKQRNPTKLMNPIEVVFPTDQVGPNPQMLWNFTESPF